MLSSYLAVCEEAARAAGRILRDMLGTPALRYKSNPNDLVTEADIAAQKMIESIVLNAFPDHHFLGEEGSNESSSKEDNASNRLSDSSEFCWIVDPLDGTTNFVHCVPLFGPSIALVRGNEVLCGVIYNPMTEEFYSAAQGQGAFLNGKPIRTSSCQTVQESLGSVSFPSSFSDDAPDIKAFWKAVPICQSLRRTGSTAINLAFVAAGRFDAFWAFANHPWDIAAGVILVQEAGGVVSKPNGLPINFSDPSSILAAANNTLQQALIPVINAS